MAAELTGLKLDGPEPDRWYGLWMLLLPFPLLSGLCSEDGAELGEPAKFKPAEFMLPFKLLPLLLLFKLEFIELGAGWLYTFEWLLAAAWKPEYIPLLFVYDDPNELGELGLTANDPDAPSDPPPLLLFMFKFWLLLLPLPVQ